MVSSQYTDPSNSSNVASEMTSTNRGFVEQSTYREPAYAYTYSSPIWRHHTPYFWGPVIAGTLFAMAFFILSFWLMIACRVGVAASGALAFGWGSAVWLVITSCLAYGFGGAIANYISRPVGTGWLKGAIVWALSLPLTLLVAGISTGAIWLGGIPLTTVNSNIGPVLAAPALGYSWFVFCVLIGGLLFAMFGSSAAGGYAFCTSATDCNTTNATTDVRDGRSL